MDEQGRLYCSAGDHMVHIDQFTPSSKDGQVWYILDGKEYVRPHARCKPCMNSYNRERYVPAELRNTSGPQVRDLPPLVLTADALTSRPDWTTMDATYRNELIARLDPVETMRLVEWVNAQQPQRN